MAFCAGRLDFLGYNAIMWFLFACHTASEPYIPVGHSDQLAPPAATDTAEEGQLLRSHCPASFVPVPYDEPEFCIMAYEASHYQNRAISVNDVVPAMNISFWRARELCENMRFSEPPSCVNPRLASWEEWRDAGDGQLGEGGLLYPWGDEADAERCVLPYSTISWWPIV